MNDRELLELAAKAAGMRLHVWGTKGAENFADMDAKADGRWNPLSDDGDALRLAVRLEMYIGNDGQIVTAQCGGCAPGQIGYLNADPHAATRRAIVRAAAELGKRSNT